MTEKRRKHYYATFEEMADRLNVPGQVIRVWVENESDYIHFLTNDPNGQATTPGGYVDAETLPGRSADVLRVDGPVELRVGDDIHQLEGPIEVRKLGDG